MYLGQRVYIHEQAYETFVDELIPKVKALEFGNPLDESTDIGPLIDKGAANTPKSGWDEAKAGGATVLAGGQRTGKLWEPTVLAQLHEDMRLFVRKPLGLLLGSMPTATYTLPFKRSMRQNSARPSRSLYQRLAAGRRCV